MMRALLLIILGLFIWLAIPEIVVKKNSGIKKFLQVTCRLIGVLIIIYATWNFLKEKF